MSQCLVGTALMDVARGEVGDATVAVLGVVPGEEAAAENDGVIDDDELARERRMLLHRLEVRLREWVVVADLGTAVALN